MARPSLRRTTHAGIVQFHTRSLRISLFCVSTVRCRPRQALVSPFGSSRAGPDVPSGGEVREGSQVQPGFYLRGSDRMCRPISIGIYYHHLVSASLTWPGVRGGAPPSDGPAGAAADDGPGARRARRRGPGVPPAAGVSCAQSARIDARAVAARHRRGASTHLRVPAGHAGARAAQPRSPGPPAGPGPRAGVRVIRAECPPRPAGSARPGRR